MKTHIEMLKEMGVADADAEQYLPHLEETLPKHGIADTRLRLAHFFAQVLHESGSMRFDMENLNYSSDALRRVFGKYFPTAEDADACARNPEKIANRVYANRMGNGDERSGDGWRYRGRGLIQVTGRGNYREAGDALELPLEAQPALLEQPQHAALSAAWFWKSHLLNALADQQRPEDDDADFVTITKKINGRTTGLAQR